MVHLLAVPHPERPCQDTLSPWLLLCTYDVLLRTANVILYVLTTWIGGVVGISYFTCSTSATRPTRRSHMHSKWDAGMLVTPTSWCVAAGRMTLSVPTHHASTQVPSYHLSACHSEGEAYCRQGKKGGLWDVQG